jgi:hypothetical protein
MADLFAHIPSMLVLSAAEAKRHSGPSNSPMRMNKLALVAEKDGMLPDCPVKIVMR